MMMSRQHLWKICKKEKCLKIHQTKMKCKGQWQAPQRPGLALSETEERTGPEASHRAQSLHIVQTVPLKSQRRDGSDAPRLHNKDVWEGCRQGSGSNRQRGCWEEASDPDDNQKGQTNSCTPRSSGHSKCHRIQGVPHRLPTDNWDWLQSKLIPLTGQSRKQRMNEQILYKYYWTITDITPFQCG